MSDAQHLVPMREVPAFPPATTTTTTTTIHQLPNEILQHILTNLCSSGVDLLRPRAVCQRWSQVIESICAVKRSVGLDLSLPAPYYAPDVDQLSLYQMKLTDFIPIKVCQTDRFSPSTGQLFAFLHRLFPNIDHLLLTINIVSDRIVVESMLNLTRLWPRLTTLVLSMTGNLFSGETQRRVLCQLVKLTHLKRLVLDNVFSFYPPAEFLEQLEFFSFGNIFILYGDGEELFQMEALALSPHCTGLNLSIYSYDDHYTFWYYRFLFDPNAGPRVFANITHLGLGFIYESRASVITNWIRRAFPSLRVLRLAFERGSLFDRAAFHDLSQLGALSTLSLNSAQCCEKFCVLFRGGVGSIAMPSVRVLHLQDTYVQPYHFNAVGYFGPPSGHVLTGFLSRMFPRLAQVRLNYVPIRLNGTTQSHQCFEQCLVSDFRHRAMFPHLKRGIFIGNNGQAVGEFIN